jgi:hypothetical protein
MPTMKLPYTIAQHIAELSKSAGDAEALARAQHLSRKTSRTDDDITTEFVDHSVAIFMAGKLFSIELHFDLPGESGKPEGIEPPFLAPPTPEEAAIIDN